MENENKNITPESNENAASQESDNKVIAPQQEEKKEEAAPIENKEEAKSTEEVVTPAAPVEEKKGFFKRLFKKKDPNAPKKEPGKVQLFFKKLFKNKVFWICFAVTLLALIVVWCIFAPKGKTSVFSSSMAMFMGLFLLLALGLSVGRITIKGINFGSAGVFLVALGLGALFAIKTSNPFLKLFTLSGDDVDIYENVLENLGLVLFASAVGFIAGPTFFRSFKSNAKSFITMGISVTIVGIMLTALIGVIMKGALGDASPFFASGLFSGAITSTPALAAAKDIAGAREILIAGNPVKASVLIVIAYAITYPLGVLGVVLFIQLMPRILKADMSMERGKLIVQALKAEMNEDKAELEKQRKGIMEKNYFEIDSYGLVPFSIAVLLGLNLGAINIPLTPSGFAGPCFSLGTTGGCLVSCIIFGHLGHIGKLSLKVPDNVNKTFREFGLIVFLAGIGIGGGYKIVNESSKIPGLGPIIAIGVALGLVITLVPMIGGYFLGKYAFKLPLLNNLGAITGSMTSTPALGALIGMAKTDDVATAYASAFPIATILTAIGMNLYLSLLA